MKKLITLLFLVLLVGCTTAPVKEVQDAGTWMIDEVETVVSMQELENHNFESDCWIAYEGKVYDVTNWDNTALTKEIHYYCGDEISAEWLIKSKYGDDFIQQIEAFSEVKGYLA